METYPTKPLTYPIVRGKSRHSKYMNFLSKIAIAVEPVAQARLASAIVYKNEIISIGINQRKSHPFQAKFSKNEDSIYLHSETDAIKNALKQISIDELSDSVLYVCRVKIINKKFVFGIAKPCCGCMRAISNFGIKKVYYTLDNKGYAML
jgi:deoxycytidylate deaminase